MFGNIRNSSVIKGWKSFILGIPNNKKRFIGLLIVLWLVVCGIWGVRLYQELKHGFNLYPLPFQTFILSGDQTAQQTILHDWQNGYDEGAVTGENTWFLKWPLYLIINNLPLSPLERQFITSGTILTLVAAGLLGLLTYIAYLVTRSKQHALFTACVVAGLIAAVPGYMFEYLSWPNSRNIELVIFLWLLILPLRYELRPKIAKKTKRRDYIIGTIVATLLFVNDPLFLYLTVPFVTIALGLRYMTGTEKRLASVLVPLCYGAIAAFGSIVIRTALIVFTPVETIMRVPFDLTSQSIAESIGAFAQGIFPLLGLHSPKTGSYVFNTAFVGLHALIFAAAIAGTALWFKKKPRSLFSQLFVLFGLWNLVLFIVRGPDASGDAAGNRYMMALYVCELVGVVMLTTQIRLRRQYVVLALTTALLLAMTTMLLVVSPYKHATHQYAIRMDAVNRIIKLLESNGLDKGYTEGGMEPFKFISGYKINPITGVCMKQRDGLDKLYFFDVLSEVSIKNSYKAHKTYFISLDQAKDGCKPELLKYQFGEPVQSFQIWSAVSGTYTISVYDYDISSRIPVQKI